MLAIQNLNVFYGESHILHDLSFELTAGETIAVMGRNGMGKTTLLKSLIGMIPSRSGEIRLGGRDLAGTKSYERVAAGFGYVPQGRMIFPYLSVEENILTGMDRMRKPKIPEYIYDSFPVLAEMRNRRGGNLSGGQQQQLAIARALVSEPKVLILDEPTEGIQPSIIKDIARALNRLKKERNFALIVSEQVLTFTLEIADRFLIIEKGRFVHADRRENVDAERIMRYLTI
ncbi:MULTISPECIES: urea ABC transporter ATP-binding subunit UrtE [Paraburkholderia]|jgi:urea transport system ATP-binding protein|uniref:Amino acid/amide ABC transporter ATP-binding protein 2, HAAT family n=1 Tax=Paraburkholderia aspalathi TaxID=1324617 RepID=A0A1I7EKE0_9BURK|nr:MULTISPECIES: urea ABC transporter ATP-binding subunit UrtE [Paraburkholderia]MCP2085014.1 urea transport system ATP-binding protein [Paraburkholderia sediminicola]MBK3818613.1 urea ABC transporter ATP-binding subunit UrtE [Paraburkholderia aspalathi]MBK3830466.1 urea ABC transporter ATP-binding subunit UrtE [Paraburkholderia aspalathi]MBK3837757.1 urea ABC transporter ATP-binding subunit UrtE [Paraburkholderia aspalathi]MBK3860167.1 urea ABC transporter ATP-binding subunit UrtE [Paraburkho